MDGNQRWALINKKNKLEGYLAGLNNLKFIIDKCIEKKKKILVEKPATLNFFVLTFSI